VKKIGEYHEKGVQDGIEYDYYRACFIVKPVGGKIKRRQESEIEHLELFNLKEIPERLVFEHAKMIQDYNIYAKQKAELRGWRLHDEVKD